METGRLGDTSPSLTMPSCVPHGDSSIPQRDFQCNHALRFVTGAAVETGRVGAGRDSAGVEVDAQPVRRRGRWAQLARGLLSED